MNRVLLVLGLMVLAPWAQAQPASHPAELAGAWKADLPGLAKIVFILPQGNLAIAKVDIIMSWQPARQG